LIVLTLSLILFLFLFLFYIGPKKKQQEPYESLW